VGAVASATVIDTDVVGLDTPPTSVAAARRTIGPGAVLDGTGMRNVVSAVVDGGFGFVPPAVVI
jgi:hypothetical protein